MERNKNPYDMLSFIGIDLIKREYTAGGLSRNVIILIDDAQTAFNDDLNKTFWTNLLKDIFLPHNIRFVITSTYLLGGTESPAEFSNQARIYPEEMLLNPTQSFDFLVKFLEFPFMNFHSLVELIIEDCGGNIGALSKFVYDGVDTDQSLKDYFISPTLTEAMDRLFGSATVLSLEEPIMIDLLYGEVMATHTALIEESTELKQYIKCGLLSRKDTGETKFSNAMSRRYFIHKTYPQTAITDPSNVFELVINCIRKMSARALTNSVVEGFPKEAVFQHLMITAMTANLTALTCVYPENSRIIGSNSAINGESDFFINGRKRWGIELLIQGRKLKEHRERFLENGKYVNLGCLQHAVVDFRGNVSGAPKKLVEKDNVITVYFKIDDFGSATCLLPDGKTIDIELSL